MGNIAGWVHVGCCGQAQHGRAANTTESCSCCCHHHCQNSASADDESTGDEPAPAPDHDPSSCNICQNLFASRHAIVIFDDAIVWTPQLTDRMTFVRSDASIEAIFLGGLSARGPPIA